MEQQPGPVNWAPYNPIPAPGMVKLWAIEAHAHGAEVVSYFRWRQAPFAQEQMHAGLNLPNAHELSPGGREAGEAARDLAALGDLPACGRAPVALVFDYEAAWVLEIQPHGASFRYIELVFRWYDALRRLGLDVDVLRPGDSLKGYALIVAPSLPIVSDAAFAAFAAADGVVVFGPRTGSKTREFSNPRPPAAGAAQSAHPDAGGRSSLHAFRRRETGRGRALRALRNGGANISKRRQACSLALPTAARRSSPRAAAITSAFGRT